MNRRAFLRTVGGAAGAATASAAATGSAVAQKGGGNKSGGNTSGGNKSGGGGNSGGGGMTTYKLGGKVAGWQGQAPSSIKGQSNPPLVLKPGQKYKIIWENLDGMMHDFTIQDSSGNTIKQTKKTSKQGKTLSLTFTASNKMAQYICTVHPTTMKGEIKHSATTTKGGQIEPHEMGVPLQPHYVGIATVLMMASSLVFTFYLLKYGVSAHTQGGNN